MIVKIYTLANNYGNNADGIGKYSYNFMNKLKEIYFNLDYKVFSSNTVGLSKIRRIFSLKMIHSTNDMIKKIKNDKPDLVLVEYPFVEENPLFIIKYKRLSKLCSKYNVKLALSLHEYSRVHWIKRMYIRKLSKYSSFILTTNKDDREKLLKYNNNIYLRKIPAGINFDASIDKMVKNQKIFVYFGLINSSKAFHEMLAAWKVFNKDREYKLEILTASDITIESSEDICILKNLSDIEIAKHLSAAKYSILPIKPCVYINNSSFVTSAQFGCICIGHFDQKLQNENFIVNINGYDFDSFSNGLKKAILKDDLLKMEAKCFGMKYDMKTVCKENYNVFCEEIGYENRN